MQLMCENSGTPRQWMATVALWATACAASAASPAYTLVEVETGALRAGCPVLNDAANLAFAFRDTSSDSQPADGVAFWSEASGVFGQARFVSGEVLTGLIGLSGKGSAVASMAAGPDFTGVASIRPGGQILTRPPGMSGPIRVTPLAATERGAVLVDGVIDGSDGAFLVRPSGKVVRQAVPYLAQASDVNDTGAAIGGSWVDSEDRFASFWRSPRGEIQPLKGLPGTGSHDQTRAASLNDRNTVVGVTILESGKKLATLWDSPSSVPRELSPPAGSEGLYCAGYGVNNRGEVVGSCSLANGQNPRLFYWSNESGMVSLSDLLPPAAVAAGAEVLQNNCISINHQGAIAFSLVDEGSAGGTPGLLKPAQ